MELPLVCKGKKNGSELKQSNDYLYMDITYDCLFVCMSKCSIKRTESDYSRMLRHPAEEISLEERHE